MAVVAGVRAMMPYDTYRLHQAERVKGPVEIQRADRQAARLAAAVSSLFQAVMRPAGGVPRSYTGAGTTVRSAWQDRPPAAA